MTNGLEIQKFEGATTALITPLHESGDIDWHSLEELVKFNVEYGIHNLVACGTTAQSPTLEDFEWRNIVMQAKESAGSFPVIAGAGTNNFEKSKKLIKFAEELRADATLHVTGYYNIPSQIGILRYFSYCAAASSAPLIMYDVPGRGHPLIQPETRIAAALQNENIIGIKDATGNEKIWGRTVELARKEGFDRHKFKLISGDDPKTFTIMKDYEGVGVISVTSNIFPQAISKLTELLLQEKYDEAKELDEALKPFNDVLGVKASYEIYPGLKIENDAFKNPAPVQYAAYILRMVKSDRLRLPLVGLSEERVPASDKRVPAEARMQVINALKQMYERNPELFVPIEKFYGVDVNDRLKEAREKNLC